MPINTSLIDTLKQEPGGFVDTSASPTLTKIAPLLDVQLAVAAGAGGGMLFLLKELVVQALAAGRCVRILDYGASFDRFVQVLDGVKMTEWNSAVWGCSSHQLVALDLESIARANWQGILQELEATPAGFWFLATEAWMYEHQLPRANCLSSLDPIDRDALICGHIKEDRMPERMPLAAREFLARGPDRNESRWVLLEGDAVYRFLMRANAKRMAAYSTRPQTCATC